MNATSFLRRSILLAAIVLLAGCEEVRPDLPPDSALRALDELQTAIEKETEEAPEPQLPAARRLAEARQDVADRIPGVKRAALLLQKGDMSEQAINEFNKLRRDLRGKRDAYENAQLAFWRARGDERDRQETADLAERQAQGVDLGVTLAAYRRIKPGMRCYEVEEIIGAPGIEQTSSGSYVIYAWSQDFATIACTTDGGKVTAKSQSGCR